MDPDMVIQPYEMALLAPLNVNGVGELMDEMKKQSYPRVEILISHDPTAFISRRSIDPVSGIIRRMYTSKPKSPNIRTPPSPIHAKVPAQPPISTPPAKVKLSPHSQTSTPYRLKPYLQDSTRTKKARTAPTTPEKQAAPTRTPTPTKQVTPSSTPGSERKKKRIPIPRSWESATAEDLLIFKLKENGGSWAEITTEWNDISGLKYACSTISNRWLKIHSTLGNPPEGAWDLDSGMSS
jgi:hypothetical protein